MAPPRRDLSGTCVRPVNPDQPEGEWECTDEGCRKNGDLRRFRNREAACQHLYHKHCNKPKLLCDYCEYGTSKPVNLETHVRNIHTRCCSSTPAMCTNGRPFCCPDCRQAFYADQAHLAKDHNMAGRCPLPNGFGGIPREGWDVINGRAIRKAQQGSAPSDANIPSNDPIGSARPPSRSSPGPSQSIRNASPRFIPQAAQHNLHLLPNAPAQSAHTFVHPPQPHGLQSLPAFVAPIQSYPRDALHGDFNTDCTAQQPTPDHYQTWPSNPGQVYPIHDVPNQVFPSNSGDASVGGPMLYNHNMANPSFDMALHPSRVVPVISGDLHTSHFDPFHYDTSPPSVSPDNRHSFASSPYRPLRSIFDGGSNLCEVADPSIPLHLNPRRQVQLPADPSHISFGTQTSSDPTFRDQTWPYLNQHPLPDFSLSSLAPVHPGTTSSHGFFLQTQPSQNSRDYLPLTRAAQHRLNPHTPTNRGSFPAPQFTQHPPQGSSRRPLLQQPRSRQNSLSVESVLSPRQKLRFQLSQVPLI